MTRHYPIYRPGFPAACFGQRLGTVQAASRREAERLGRLQFGGPVVAGWPRRPSARALPPGVPTNPNAAPR